MDNFIFLALCYYYISIIKVAKFMTQCQKLRISPGFIISCHKQVYDGLLHDSVIKAYIFINIDMSE